jgi:hypothetical protein
MRQIGRFARTLGDVAAAAAIPAMVQQAAMRYGVDPALALAVARRESGLNQSAVSAAGAIGVMQLLPATAAQYGADPYNTAENIDAGVRYLRDLLNQYGDTAKALAAYNWGPGNLNRAIATYGDAWLNHAPAETQAYVAAIAGVQPSAGPAAPTSVPALLTIDATTGQVVDESKVPDISTLPSASGGISTNALLLTGIGVGLYFLADWLSD